MHRVRRALGAGAAGIAAIGLLVGAAAPARAVEDVQSERVAGVDRFATAAEIATTGWPGGSTTVVVASGRAFPDALAGAAIGLPVLLTEPDALPSATAAAIEDLGATDAFLLGGTAAVSDDVETELAGMVDVVRIAGQDRYETAAAIAEAIGADDVAEIDGLRTALVATGLQFADALAGGPIASGVTGGSMPVLLVGGDVPDATSAALESLDIEQVILLGGTGAVAPSVESELETQTGNDAVRLAGANRFATAAEIAQYAIDTLDFAGDEVLLANGLVFADALAGGPLGGQTGAPLLLTEAGALNNDTATFLDDHSDTIETITTLGGTAAVSDATAADAESAAESVENDAATTRVNEAFAVSPDTAASQGNGSTRDYTASGLTSAVDIVLVRCAGVQTTSDGRTVFSNANTNGTADGTSNAGSADAADEASTAAAITVVNGTSRNPSDPTINNDYAENVSPTNGQVTFTVTGPSGSTASECVVPVVFGDANDDDGLNGSTANPTVPTEPFGTGGATTFTPSSAGSGSFDVNVDASLDAQDAFIGCDIITQAPTEIADGDDAACLTYTYDANDVFQLNAVAVTMAVFEQTLTAGDDVRSGNYSATPADRSTFNLYSDEAPLAPATSDLAPPQADADGVTITFIDSQTATTDSYRLYRALDQPAGCPTFGLTTHALVATAEDQAKGEFDPTVTYEIVDTTAAQGTAYCYRLLSVDDGDEGPVGDAIEVTAAGTPGAPTITGATGSSANGTLDAGDQHRLVFSEAMDPDTATGNYTVTGTGSPLSTAIDCGIDATCILSFDRTTLTIELSPTTLVPPLSYPLTITATDGMTDAGGADVTLTGSDVTIEQQTLSAAADGDGPFIATAEQTTDTGTTEFLEVGDAVDLVFSESIALDDADGLLTVAQVRAITGVNDIGYTAENSIRATVVGNATLRLTVVTALAQGIDLADVVDGTANNNVTDLFANPQRANPDADPTLTA